MEKADPLRGLSQDLYFTVRLLGTLLWLVAYLLDESVNLDHRTTLLALLYFRSEFASQWGSIAVWWGPLLCNGLIRGNRRNPSPRRYYILVRVYKRYVYIRQQEHRGHTVCLRYMIVD